MVRLPLGTVRACGNFVGPSGAAGFKRKAWPFGDIVMMQWCSLCVAMKREGFPRMQNCHCVYRTMVYLMLIERYSIAHDRIHAWRLSECPKIASAKSGMGPTEAGAACLTPPNVLHFVSAA
jgi:hypothetical protein